MLQPTTTRPIENPSARERTRPSPWAFVPPLYFLQGMPYFIVDTCTTTFFKALEVPVASIGHISSLLTLPWMLKPLWSPIVDIVATKRLWTVAMQFLVAAGLAFLALAATRSDVVMWSVAACAWIAIAAATHDVACDGYYLLALDLGQQAAFVGVRSACFRLARVFVTGGVVYLAGALAEGSGEAPSRAGVQRAWMLAFACAAVAYVLALAWGLFAMPRPRLDASSRSDVGPASNVPPLLEAV